MHKGSKLIALILNSHIDEYPPTAFFNETKKQTNKQTNKKKQNKAKPKVGLTDNEKFSAQYCCVSMMTCCVFV